MHAKRILSSGLPASQVELDASRLALAFYCLGTLDLLNATDKTREGDRASWREWMWEQQCHGAHGTGFRPSPYMTPSDSEPNAYGEYDAPNLIMTYTALLCLSILRDDFSRLDRAGLLRFIRSCQCADGGFGTVPGATDRDLRLVFCAFAVSSMLGDFSGMNVEAAIAFIKRCRTYEGGYGQEPHGEALGGTTYCALAALGLVPADAASSARLTPVERAQTVRWLLQNQDAEEGGFSGRTGKLADACYCFWCGASLAILGASDLIDADRHAAFLSRCQFRFGGLAKAPGEHPDPYHTYLSLAILALVPPSGAEGYSLERLDPLLNAKRETERWLRERVPERR